MNTDKFKLIPSKTYAITFNGRNEFQYVHMIDPKVRWQKCTSFISSLFKDCISFTYKLYFEISDPDHMNYTQCTRVHAHGHIIIHDLPLFLLVEYNYLTTYGDIKLVEQKDDGYLMYSQKQHEYLDGYQPLLCQSAPLPLFNYREQHLEDWVRLRYKKDEKLKQKKKEI